MHTVMRFTLVCVCVCATFLIVGVRESRCEDVPGAAGAAGAAEGAGASSDAAADRKEPRSATLHLPDGSRRSGAGATTATAVNASSARDSQLLSLAAARRKQLFSDRLTQHIHTLAAISHKPHRNSTAQPEQRNMTGTLTRRLALVDNSTWKGHKSEARLDPALSSKEVTRLDARAPEPNSPMPMKLYQDPRSRAGFLNNKRKESEGARSNSTEGATVAGGILYVPEPDDKLDGPEQEALVDPDEEFQVDESSHGIYLLNFSDPSNLTDSTKNKIIGDDATKERNFVSDGTTIRNRNISKEVDVSENQVTPNVTTTVDDTTSTADNRTTKYIKTENAKENENNTLFMSDEIYNHFRPLESELRAEDMAQFMFFGQKLSTPIQGGDNLTNSPSFSASTKSVNYISPLPEKKKYTSRYSATEKTKNGSVGEEEINEEMDVSVVKNVIEKNKIRNSVKGPAPARHISLLNAYRKPLNTVSVSKVPNIPETNVTLTDEGRETNLTSKDFPLRSNYRNHSRNYFNTRRRPARLTTVDSVALPPVNATTEKSSTLFYTAVVTSVSITSSMKGQNKTDLNKELNVTNENIGIISQLNATTPENVVLNETESTSVRPSSTFKPRHRVRIRTTTERIGTNESFPSPTPFVLMNRRQPIAKFYESPKSISRNESQTSPPLNFSARGSFNSKTDESNISDVIGPRLSLDGILTIDQRNESEASSTIRPRPAKTRRRSTTTTSTLFPPTVSASTTTLTSPLLNIPISDYPLDTTAKEIENTSIPSAPTTKFVDELAVETSNYQPRDKTEENKLPSGDINATESISNSTPTSSNQNIKVPDDVPTRPNEEVVIEAEKNYTASYVLAGLGFLPVTAIIVFVLRNVLLKKTKELDTEYEGYFDEGEPKKESPITPVARLAMPLPAKPDQKWEFPRNKLRLQTLLGQGNFGQVWKAEADDLSGHDGLTRLVAVKTIKDTATQKEKQELLHEICIMQKIGTHPNVVTLLACCTEQEPYLLVMEYVMCGKLLTYLRERRARPDRFGAAGGSLTSRDLTVFAYCVARGMEYLAAKGIVHRDLAARNVLVDHNKLCKIADFGMSREMASPGEGGEGCAGAGGGAAGGGGRAQRHALPVRWMAPEALLYNVFNHETDVWAYGILLWEIVTLGSTPYASMCGREVLQVVSEGYRLERPAHCKPALYRAMHACWHAAPGQRPPFQAIKAQLAELLDNEPSEGNYVDLDSFYQDSSVYSDPSAIIPDDADAAAELDYSAERRALSGAEYEARFGFPPPLRSDFIGSPRMSGFGIRDLGFRDQNFNERKEGKLSGASFQRERDREREPPGGNQLASRNSFSGGFQRLGSRGRDPGARGFQLMSDGTRNKRVPEFECDI